MNPRHCRTTLHLSPDGRMIAGIGGAVAHHAEHAGLCDQTRDSLAAGLEEFCRRTLPLLNGRASRLDVAIEEYEDRLEILVRHCGQASPSVGVEAFLAASAAGANGLHGVRLLRLVDRVEYDSRNGDVRTKMIKYLRQHSQKNGSR
jgi:hypothetical protein